MSKIFLRKRPRNKIMRVHIMTLDPGISGSGYAVWDEEKFINQTMNDEVTYFVPEFHTVHHFKQVHKYYDQLAIYIKSFRISKIYIENPTFD